MIRKNFYDTWFLIGLVRDINSSDGKEKMLFREKIKKKLKLRLDGGIDTDAFEAYFKQFNITREDLEI